MRLAAWLWWTQYHYDEITKYDNSATFKAKAYVMEIKE